jgi:hypothetical protein
MFGAILLESMNNESDKVIGFIIAELTIRLSNLILSTTYRHTVSNARQTIRLSARHPLYLPYIQPDTPFQTHD